MDSHHKKRRRVRNHAFGSRSRRPHFEVLESRRMMYGGIESFAPVMAEGEDAQMPDFSLNDVNETSPTFGQPISPRNYLQEVSAWYFGHGS